MVRLTGVLQKGYGIKGLKMVRPTGRSVCLARAWMWPCRRKPEAEWWLSVDREKEKVQDNAECSYPGDQMAGEMTTIWEPFLRNLGTRGHTDH